MNKYFKFSKYIALFFLVFIFSCSIKDKPYRIGIDRTFYPEDFEGQGSYVYGFVEEVLLDIAKDQKIEFLTIEANWDTKYSFLENDRFDAIFSSLDPYNFNVAKYDFSNTFLPTGPVLITYKQSKIKSMMDLSNRHVGVIRGNNSSLILEKNPEIFIEPYDSIVEMLDDMIDNNIDAAVADFIPANKYIIDLYSTRFAILYPPLTKSGIKMITKKDQNAELLKIFNRGLKNLQRDNKLNEIKNKWGLPLLEKGS